MNRRVPWLTRFRRWAGIATLGLLIAGCATTRIDWGKRVGNYTFDQAVVELGPPDKQAQLQDKSIVAEWLTRRGYSYTTPLYGGYYYPYHGPIYPSYTEGYAPDAFLRLTFGPDAKLQSWKTFSR